MSKTILNKNIKEKGEKVIEGESQETWECLKHVIRWIESGKTTSSIIMVFSESVSSLRSPYESGDCGSFAKSAMDEIESVEIEGRLWRRPLSSESDVCAHSFAPCTKKQNKDWNGTAIDTWYARARAKAIASARAASIILAASLFFSHHFSFWPGDSAPPFCSSPGG